MLFYHAPNLRALSAVGKHAVSEANMKKWREVTLAELRPAFHVNADAFCDIIDQLN
jgi:hypothetical protein